MSSPENVSIEELAKISNENNNSNNNNNDINKLTLELFMNKNNYKKYLSKTDPKKYEEHQKHISNINKYKQSIMQLTNDLMRDPDMQITTEVNEMFENYTKTLIHHFQQKEYENTPYNNEFAKDDDEDMLFGTIDNDNNNNNDNHAMQSFWGKDRVVKKPQSQMEYDLQLFSRGRTK